MADEGLARGTSNRSIEAGDAAQGTESRGTKDRGTLIVSRLLKATLSELNQLRPKYEVLLEPGVHSDKCGGPARNLPLVNKYRILQDEVGSWRIAAQKGLVTQDTQLGHWSRALYEIGNERVDLAYKVKFHYEELWDKQTHALRLLQPKMSSTREAFLYLRQEMVRVKYQKEMVATLVKGIDAMEFLEKLLHILKTGPLTVKLAPGLTKDAAIIFGKGVSIKAVMSKIAEDMAILRILSNYRTTPEVIEQQYSESVAQLKKVVERREEYNRELMKALQQAREPITPPIATGFQEGVVY